ncbi:MAG: DEAD/DEAH box helicase [Chitinophagales bacterium]|nr:DEAD/DEAH box helicase [Chitinophagales bacterium]
MPLTTQQTTHLANLGIETLNPMQEEALASIREATQTIIIAPTGSGKTVAFLLPMVELLKREEKGIQCIILAPTRELAIQIEQVWKKMGTGYKVNAFYGGHSMRVEKQSLSEPPAVLIGTPGRIADHLTRRTLDLRGVHALILDEFDKSLAMGFQDQMSYIIQNLRHLQTKVLVSATESVDIPEFVGIENPTKINYSNDVESESKLIVHTVKLPGKDKMAGLVDLLSHLGMSSTIMFCNHRESVEKTSDYLKSKGIENAFFHGGMDQIDREKVLIQFRNGSATFLVATDLAARGLDIESVKNIIHVELPFLEEDFIHRNGRTARMNADGNAFLLMHSEERLPKFIEEVPSEYIVKKSLTLPPPSVWTTLYFSGGKKDKLSKGDIMGFLSKTGGLERDEIGLIEQLDFMSFAAVKRNTLKKLLPILQLEKVKGKKYKIIEVKLNGS